jgi:hypothetical protein
MTEQIALYFYPSLNAWYDLVYDVYPGKFYMEAERGREVSTRIPLGFLIGRTRRPISLALDLEL